MKAYKFRVVIDTQEDIFRDINVSGISGLVANIFPSQMV